MRAIIAIAAVLLIAGESQARPSVRVNVGRGGGFNSFGRLGGGFNRGLVNVNVGGGGFNQGFRSGFNNGFNRGFGFNSFGYGRAFGYGGFGGLAVGAYGVPLGYSAPVVVQGSQAVYGAPVAQEIDPLAAAYAAQAVYAAPVSYGVPLYYAAPLYSGGFYGAPSFGYGFGHFGGRFGFHR